MMSWINFERPRFAVCFDCGKDFDLNLEGSEYDEGDGMDVAICGECGQEENPTGRHLETAWDPGV